MANIQHLTEKEFIASSLKGPKITCSFLIPLELLKKLPKSDQLKIGKNLGQLLRTHSKYIKSKKRFNKSALTVKYQRKGNSLVKFNSRVFPEEWAQLSILSAIHGVSRCLLYCLLIQLHLTGTLIKPNHNLQKIQEIVLPAFIWEINLKTKMIRRIIYHRL
ncbi:DUF1564 domain-containing protein [Leptospira sp. FAT2]|uniref:DUF1564 family protein n=1 Tax=Leptospira sanjuanensis TaxID=2879643 RepID=UPI001EE82D37|nr:DUF1564 family protein [Leptospira sanjuanensis]MCG6168951.1 DUF1564 domain-containing protein [Leptospira sanjuanensis]MCG6194351.1 DUF1564 domain-containing protein [Leptospira sanjuanensis]